MQVTATSKKGKKEAQEPGERVQDDWSTEQSKSYQRSEKIAKRGKGLINGIVEVKYKEKNEDGELCYLGWFTRTITAYNSHQWYLVQSQIL